ncbi:MULTISPECIES: hypothetical protein [Streptomyces]|jgi:uncharacterized membrane protein|uniref:Beta/gamma crystallin n=1 Tax=Streptomyces sp. 900129855 TaxID=3155129 RepID=A0ABV2ZZB2_9ACTN
MRDLRRKLTIAALAVASVFGGLATPGTASAATAYAQIRICNNNSAALKFYIVGYNDHGDWVSSRFWDVRANGCTTAADYWWQTDRSVEFHYARPPKGWTWKQLYVPKAKNGSTSQFSIS